MFFTSKEAQEFAAKSQTLSERERKTLAYVQKHGSITSSQYQKLFSVKDRQARKDLNAMVGAGLLRAEKRGRSSRYIVPDWCRNREIGLAA